MVIDYKYHIASLVSVFMALGLGILIGTAMMGNDVLVKEQRALIDRLQQDYSIARGEKRALADRATMLENDIQREQEFEKMVLPHLIKGRLSGKKIAIVTTNDLENSQLIDSVASTLKMAGAVVTSSTRIFHSMDLSDRKQKDREQIVSVLELESTEELQDIAVSLTNEVARDIAIGTNVALPALSDMKLIHTSGDYKKSVDGIVLLSGRAEKAEEGTPRVDDILIKSFKELGVSVVGTESKDTTYSQVNVFNSNQIASVDNIDTVPGLLSLVVSLQGANGAYGIKSTAKQLTPDLSLWPMPINE